MVAHIQIVSVFTGHADCRELGWEFWRYPEVEGIVLVRKLIGLEKANILIIIVVIEGSLTQTVGILGVKELCSEQGLVHALILVLWANHSLIFRHLL